MSFLNLGRTDEYGNQRRIEHRGRNLRASRTGGVALRTRAKASGVNVTANTSTGFRVSTQPLQNTQLALQNGRFVLKGRYGKGPTKLNLSKSGVSVSTGNQLGSFNWFKPNRSSAKFAGIQVRGKRAAWFQVVYMAFAALAALLQLVLQVLLWAGRAVLALLTLVYRLALATPYALRTLKRRLRNRRLEDRIPDSAALFTSPPAEWSRAELLAGVLLVLEAWGRGRKAVGVAEQIAPRLKDSNESLLREAQPAFARVAQRLEVARNEAGDEARSVPQTCMALLARCISQALSAEVTAEALLQADEFALAQGQRTRLQEQLLEVFTDFAGIRFQESEAPPAEPAMDHAEPTGQDASGLIDLNSASREELETIPHLGPERAEEVMAMRPFSELSDLTAIRGIGPKRLETIQAHAVVGSKSE